MLPANNCIDGTTRTALLVEDDPRLRNAMHKVLERMNFHVLSACHYDAAVCHLERATPHLACVDVGLPNKSGYELSEHIRASPRLAKLPILMMSECGSPEDLAYAEEAGGNAFLCKRFSMRQLSECVEAMLNPSPWSAPLQHELRPLTWSPLSARWQRPGYATLLAAA